jgi:hypothetical protein
MSNPRPPGSWDPDELAAAIVAEFDAVELGNDEDTSVAVDCWHPGRHAGREWRLADSAHRVCGGCHAPAVGLAAVWRAAL